MRITDEIDSIITALQQRFDYDYGVGMAGFCVEDGNDGHLLITNRRKGYDYEVTVEIRRGGYACKLAKFEEGELYRILAMVSDDPQEVVDWVIKTIAPSAKTIDINESRRPRGRALKESADRVKEEDVSKINEWNWCAPSARELAKGLKDGVKELWESRDEGGCIHWPVYTDDNGTEFDIVLGWESGYEDNPDYYFDDGYAICYAIKCQEQNNAMQTDMEMDFEYPYDEESGETFDWGGHISRKQDYNKLAKELLKAAKAIVSDCAIDDDYDEDE